MRRTDLAFFLAGAAALAYETIWARLLARVVGSDAVAAALVLAVFMGGMGLGAALAADFARSARRPVRAWAGVELAIAGWAAASPWLLASLQPVESSAARALVGIAILLPPTLCLGATFPLMGRIAIRSPAEVGVETSAFYGANTLGAAVGALLAPFVLMPLLGLSGALVAAALLDVLAAALVSLSVPEPESEDEGRDAAEARAPFRAWRDPLSWAVFVFGASALALEVILLRLLVTVTGASVFAFAIVTSVFLLGIGIGSRQLAERRTRTGVPASARAERAEKSRAVVFWCGLSIPLLALAGLFALRSQLGEADLFAGLSNRLPQGASVVRAWLSHALFAALCLLPPAVAFGMALPSAASAASARHATVARERVLGSIYAWNTAGALAGSLVAGFVLLPVVGPRVGTLIALVLPVFASLLVERRRVAPIAVCLAATGVVGFLVMRPVETRGARTVVMLAHDAHTTALVEESRTRAGQTVRSLRVNGKSEASTAEVDVRLQYLLAHVPGLLHGSVRDALVIGLGTGMTSGALLDLPELHALEIVEISPAVARAARTFAEWNGAVLDDPRVTLTLADGRHRLATTSARFDLVTSDPVHPWTRGSSDLYTREHFAAMRAHLAPGGVASQWLPLYELSTDDVRTVVATFAAAFEHVSAWLTAYDLVLVGSERALANEARLAEMDLPPRVRAAGRRIGIDSGLDVALLQCASDADLRAFAAGVEPMTDDRPRLEFQAPLSALSGYSTEVLRWAARDPFVDALPESVRPRARAFRAAVARFLDALPRGFTPAADALGADIRGLRAVDAVAPPSNAR